METRTTHVGETRTCQRVTRQPTHQPCFLGRTRLVSWLTRFYCAGWAASWMVWSLFRCWLCQRHQLRVFFPKAGDAFSRQPSIPPRSHWPIRTAGCSINLHWLEMPQVTRNLLCCATGNQQLISFWRLFRWPINHRLDMKLMMPLRHTATHSRPCLSRAA